MEGLLVLFQEFIHQKVPLIYGKSAMTFGVSAFYTFSVTSIPLKMNGAVFIIPKILKNVSKSL